MMTSVVVLLVLILLVLIQIARQLETIESQSQAAIKEILDYLKPMCQSIGSIRTAIWELEDRKSGPAKNGKDE